MSVIKTPPDYSYDGGCGDSNCGICQEDARKSREAHEMKMNNDPKWLKKMADAEDGCEVSVGHNENCRCPNCIEVSFRINAEHAAKIDALRKDWESGDYGCSFDEFCDWYLKVRK